jgi:hypothetical protein
MALRREKEGAGVKGSINYQENFVRIAQEILHLWSITNGKRPSLKLFIRWKHVLRSECARKRGRDLIMLCRLNSKFES